MATYRESVVAYIASDPPALLWSGVGPLPLPADIVLPAPMTALGGGELLSVPDFQQLINGTAQRLDFSLSGVDEETVRLATEDAPSVNGAAVHLGTIQFDENWQADAIEWEATFQARSLSVSRTGDSSGGGQRTITLTIASGETQRSRASNAFFTDADQQRKHPGDSIFSHVAGINAGTSRRFGPSD